MWLNHPVPSSFHIRARQLDHSWVFRFYNTQVAPRKYLNCFRVMGEGNWRIPSTQSEDSLSYLCEIWTPRWVTFVLTICALAWETLYPLSPRKFRTWIACPWTFFSSGEQISRSSTYCNSFPLGPRSWSRRSQLTACPKRWGLSLNSWGNTVQVICWCFSPGAFHSKAKRYWNSLANGMQKDAFLKSRTINHLALGGIFPKIT